MSILAAPPGPGEGARPPGRLAVSVRELHEVFRVYHERPPGLKERLYRLRRARYTRFHALDGVDLDVRHGETVGLIGHNGSGKSTLLKCVAGILPADRGEVVVDGRVATLLELGAGFHEELSGRENIYLNGAILGLSRREVSAAFDDIVEFAGVRDFIDAPVRNYSSGMYVRLGFAIAVHVDPDVLLVDEVLSVGDAAFQERSLARMRTFSERGKTVVLVSHDLGAVRSLCERTVVLHAGKVAFDGPTDEAVEAYQRLMTTGSLPARPVPRPDGAQAAAERSGDLRARVTSCSVEVPEKSIVNRTASEPVTVGPVPSGARTVVVVEITATDDLVGEGGLAAGIHVRRPDVQPTVYETRTSWRVTYLAPPPEGASLTVTFDLEANLLTGAYLVDLVVGNAETGALHDRWAGVVELQVEGPSHDQGIAPLRAEIAVHNPEGVWPAGSHPPPESEGGPRRQPLRDGDASVEPGSR